MCNTNIYKHIKALRQAGARTVHQGLGPIKDTS